VFLRVLVTAEVIAIPYYTALRDCTGSPLLGAICTRILREEAAHLRFQAFTLARLAGRRPAIARQWARTLHGWFLIATTALVWVEHRHVLRAGGYSHARLRRHALAEFETLWIR
jgi:1,2-phenylacetyl-CoA epoxidase catalytic subunit